MSNTNLRGTQFAAIFFFEGILLAAANNKLLESPMAGVLVGLPFAILALISWLQCRGKAEADEGRTGPLVGAGIGATFAALIPMTMAIRGILTGWPGGADIGMGVMYMATPIVALVFGAVGFAIGSVVSRSSAK